MQSGLPETRAPHVAFKHILLEDVPTAWRGEVPEATMVESARKAGVARNEIESTIAVAVPHCRMAMQYQQWLIDNPMEESIGICIMALETWMDDYGGVPGLQQFARGLAIDGKPPTTSTMRVFFSHRNFQPGA